MKKATHRRCPYCKSRELLLCGKGPYWVNCDGCGADGPIKHTKESAWNAWDFGTQPNTFN